MLDYLTQIKPLLDAGRTSLQIADHYKAKTATSVSCSSIKVLLEENGVVIEDPVTLTRSGSLITHYTGMADGATKTLLGWFISHVFGRGETIASDTQPRATQIVDTIANLPGPMQAIGAEIIELGGGQPYVNVTAAIVDEVIASHAATTLDEARKVSLDALRAEIENTWINPAISDGVSDAVAVRAAIKAGL